MMTRRAHRRTPGLAALAMIVWLAAPAGIAAHSTPSASPEAPPVASEPRNLEREAVEFFIDPDSNAARQADEWRETRPEDAEAMTKIAGQPVADWFGGWVEDIRPAVDARVTQLTDAGALPVFVVYDIPYRDCGQYSAGGQNDPESYRAWISEYAVGIGDRPAVVVLEPDGLTLTDCLDTEQTRERFDLLAFAVDTFAAQPSVDVYIDAGHSDWLSAEVVARRLQLAGIDRAAGFSLNVSNFQTTADSVAYGLRVSDAIGSGGTPFVIDTSRNGNGPWQSDDPEAWCNPPERALGDRPTVDTADPLVDAYLWIKRVGESDGACRGAPEAGVWYPEYALELAKNADW